MLEVSTKGAGEAFKQLAHKEKACPRVFLHFGVASNATSIRLESQGA